MPKLTVKQWCLLALIVLLLLALLGWRSGCQAAKRAGAERDQAVVVGDQMDRVSTGTDAIRQDQQEKTDAVAEIDGADERLPDGFGADLERVRRGGRDQHPR